MYLIIVPIRASPIVNNRPPAKIVQITRLSNPYFCPIPKRITMNAPVGPPIDTFVPPSAEIMNPAITAVKIPASGFTPEAIAKAIASGNATIPTVIPATRSGTSSLPEYPFTVSNSRGRNGILRFMKTTIHFTELLSLSFWPGDHPGPPRRQQRRLAQDLKHALAITCATQLLNKSWVLAKPPHRRNQAQICSGFHLRHREKEHYFRTDAP